MKMEAEKQEAIERSQCCEFKLSWVAYIRPAALFVLLCGVGFVCGSRSFMVGVVVILVALAMFCYKVCLLRSVRLYTDTRGAWIHRGVFPWDRGTTGVAWRDMDSAVYFTGFASWACKSYSVRVAHRFTKSSEIIVTHVKDGDKAVVHINELRRLRIESGAA
jgi:hypothetical protein